MNPSASGWIQKFLTRLGKERLIDEFTDDVHFYHRLKSTGFIYGVSLDSLPEEPLSDLQLTKEEYTKINLFHALLFTYFVKNHNAEFDDAINEIIRFYKNIEKGKTSFFQKLSLSQTPSNNLEHILSSRLNESNSVLKRNTVSLLTYALLYVDVLAFRVFLNAPDSLKKYSEDLETLLINCSLLALQAKEKKNKYDLQLLELFESSSIFMEGNTTLEQLQNMASLNGIITQDILAKKFLFDICSLAVWDDHILDDSEYAFLQQLASVLDFTKQDLDTSILEMTGFSESHTAKVTLFEHAHPVNQFYKQSVATVKLLILRNKNRLLKELNESGELLLLLSQSTLRDLSVEEKQKVKDQLLDICKTIPSLTIFLLPGGTVLLPLLVKFIPKLLPSAFNENRIEEK